MVRKYRSSVPFYMGMVFATLFLLFGIAMAVPTSTSDVAEHVIGVFVIAVSIWAGGLAWTTSVLLTPDGIVKRQRYRRTSIPWDAVGSFSVAPLPGNPAWRTIKVELRPTGYSYLTPLAGRARYIQRVIAELEEYRDALG